MLLPLLRDWDLGSKWADGLAADRSYFRDIDLRQCEWPNSEKIS